MSDRKTPKPASHPIQECLHHILSKKQSTQRSESCEWIRKTLKVNDVVAENCLRHIESNLLNDASFRSELSQVIAPTANLSSLENRSMISRFLGIHGPAATGILSNIDQQRRNRKD